MIDAMFVYNMYEDMIEMTGWSLTSERLILDY